MKTLLGRPGPRIRTRRQSVDRLAQCGLASLDREAADDAVPRGLSIPAVEGLSDRVGRGRRILFRDVVPRISHERRDSGDAGPDRDASARHRFAKRVREPLVERGLHVYPSPAILFEEFRLADDWEDSHIRGRHSPQADGCLVGSSPDEDERQVGMIGGGPHKRLEAFPSDIGIHDRAHSQDVRPRAVIRGEAVDVEARGDRDDLPTTDSCVPCEFLPQEVIDDEDPVRVQDGVSTPGGLAWLKVDAVSEIGAPRGVDTANHYDALAAEGPRDPARSVRMIEGEPCEDHVASRDGGNQGRDTALPAPQHASQRIVVSEERAIDLDETGLRARDERDSRRPHACFLITSRTMPRNMGAWRSQQYRVSNASRPRAPRDSSSDRRFIQSRTAAVTCSRSDSATVTPDPDSSTTARMAG